MHIKGDGKMINIEEILGSRFVMRKNNIDSADIFYDHLDKYLEIEVYDSFTELLEVNEHFRYNADGELIPMYEIMPNLMEGEKIFADFLDNILNIDHWNRISLDDVTEPILYAFVYADHEVSCHIVKQSDVELIPFINDVLRDLGEITTSNGLKNQYEVIERAE